MIVELARHMGIQVMGLALDREKCFDRLHYEIIFKLAEVAGLPQAILRPWRAMYREAKRVFKLKDSFGQLWTSATGLFQ